MHGTSFPNISVFLLTLIAMFVVSAGGQQKAAAEIAVIKCWAYPIKDAASGALTRDANTLFFGERGGMIEAVGLDGKKLWSSELGGELRSDLLTTETGLILATSAESSKTDAVEETVLRSLSKATGITTWTQKLPAAEKYYFGLHGGQMIVIAASGSILSLDDKTGALKWKREIASGFVAEPAFTAEKVLVAAAGKQVFCISLATGEIEFMVKADFGVTALAATPFGDVIIGDDRGNVSSISGLTQKFNWRFKSGGAIAGITALAGEMLVTSNDNFVYKVLNRNGDVQWKQRFAGRLSSPATPAAGFAFASSPEENTALLTDLASGKPSARILFAEGEVLLAPPVNSAKMFYLMTNVAAYAYGIDGCGLKKDGG